jgi:mannose-6-phosphate isomerase-like protein (cupin superfamily)
MKGYIVARSTKVRLAPGETYTVRPGRAHLVTNAGEASATFLVLQGIGEYDYVPLTGPDAKAK